MQIPHTTARKITCNIFPSSIGAIKFLGTIPTIVETNDTGVVSTGAPPVTPSCGTSPPKNKTPVNRLIKEAATVVNA